MIKEVSIDSKRGSPRTGLGQYQHKYQEGTAWVIGGRWGMDGLGQEILLQGKKSYQLGQTL